MAKRNENDRITEDMTDKDIENLIESCSSDGFIDFRSMELLSKDIRDAAKLMSKQEARYLVDTYYNIQASRTRTSNQIREVKQGNEPSRVIMWYLRNSELLEKQIKRALHAYALGHEVGAWALSIYGIGPVISAGLLAHIDIEKALYVGNIWSFAGLSPNIEWKKGQKRPWNADLKVLCWKVGQSFLKFSNREECYYGKLFAERWEFEKQQNESGLFKLQAEQKLEKYNIGKDKKAYEFYSSGKLPPAHILQRACRWTVKLFLSHWHSVAYECHYGKKPPKPYVIQHLGHERYLPPPNWDGVK